ncbi:MAG: 2-C-methyl-D-erythritol 2,4-cyclodiphosphate synthase [Candidatus Eremiobacterota bacterium]
MFRVGNGFDVHRLVHGRDLILGGVKIPYEKGLLGHSDADVLLHAIMDALLGAAGERDIGYHFPDNDMKYKGISSMALLEIVRNKIKDKGYNLNNLDSIIVAEKPKVSSFIEEMRENISNVMMVDHGRINIKATTTETLGFTGRGEGIAAYSTVSLIRI